MKGRVVLGTLLPALGATAALLVAASPPSPSSIPPSRRAVAQKEQERLTAYFGPEQAASWVAEVPLNLIAMLSRSVDTPDRAGFEREYGEIGKLIAHAESPVGFEIVQAYKVVWGKAVRKIRTLHVPDDTDVVDLDSFKEKILAIAAAQEPYCAGR